MRLTELHGPDTSAADYESTHEAWRLRLALALRIASAQLARLAQRLTPSKRLRRKPELEFYAEAGAPEGALFADGRRIGSIAGVTRL